MIINIVETMTHWIHFLLLQPTQETQFTHIIKVSLYASSPSIGNCHTTQFDQGHGRIDRGRGLYYCDRYCFTSQHSIEGFLEIKYISAFYCIMDHMKMVVATEPIQVINCNADLLQLSNLYKIKQSVVKPFAIVLVSCTLKKATKVADQSFVLAATNQESSISHNKSTPFLIIV